VNASPLIDIQSITYTYPVQKMKRETPSVPALDHVSLQVQQGEYLAILGHNGSGKSTLARHCNALLTPDSGRVLVAGLDTCDREKQRTIRDMVGMIFQNPDNQIIATVVEDDVAWALAVRGLPASLIRERVTAVMEAVGILDLRGKPPHRLSGPFGGGARVPPPLSPEPPPARARDGPRGTRAGALQVPAHAAAPRLADAAAHRDGTRRKRRHGGDRPGEGVSSR